MLKKIFGFGKDGAKNTNKQPEDVLAQDPSVYLSIGADNLFQELLQKLAGENRGVHLESLLAALGSLAGYACQANLRTQALERGMPPDAAFQVVKTADGNRYFFGDPLNEVLAGSGLSVWTLAAGAAQHAGASQIPDVLEIFKYSSSVVGSDKFGLPRLPDGHDLSTTPINYVTMLWPEMIKIVQKHCQKPSEWPILFGLAIQKAIDAGKSTLDPSLALKIVMECAVPMSKVEIKNT